jgi:hypothetical protein
VPIGSTGPGATVGSYSGFGTGLEAIEEGQMIGPGLVQTANLWIVLPKTSRALLQYPKAAKEYLVGVGITG